MHGNVTDISGNKYGRLTVREYAGSNDRGFAMWRCVCDCGNEALVMGSRLRCGKTSSCGCLYREKIANVARANRKYPAGVTRTPEYRTWVNMRFRCSKETHPDWANYGARGISVAAEWDSFDTFLADVGPRPGRGYSLDRIDNNGDYEPGNCRWATNQQQSNNKRTNRVVVVNGDTMTVSEAARRVGLPPKKVLLRLWYGWPLERALS